VLPPGAAQFKLDGAYSLKLFREVEAATPLATSKPRCLRKKSS
jgi:hypothetical protein